jgi:hypothetical protein
MTKLLTGNLKFSTENWLAIYCSILVKHFQIFQNTFRVGVKDFYERNTGYINLLIWLTANRPCQ